mgnify:FL=1
MAPLVINKQGGRGKKKKIINRDFRNKFEMLLTYFSQVPQNTKSVPKATGYQCFK